MVGCGRLNRTTNLLERQDHETRVSTAFSRCPGLLAVPSVARVWQVGESCERVFASRSKRCRTAVIRWRPRLRPIKETARLPERAAVSFSPGAPRTSDPLAADRNPAGR